MTTPCALRWASLLGLLVVLALTAAESQAEPARTRPAPSERPATERPPAPPPLPVVRSLDWEGNENLSGAQLGAVAFTRGPDWRFWRKKMEFSEPTLVGDMDRVESLYQLHGFYEAKASYALAWNTSHTSVAITVSIEEGPAITLTRFDVALPDDVDLPTDVVESLLRKLPLEVGDPFSPDRYARAKGLLLDRLAESAHPLARIEGGATVNLDDHHAEVDWRVVAGPTVYLGEIRVVGLYQVDEATARREIRIEPGNLYSPKRLQRTRRNLQQQGLYSWVTVQSRPAEATPVGDRDAADPVAETADATREDDSASAETTPPAGDAPASKAPASEKQVWPVEIRVTERSPYTFDAGVGYSSDESFRATVGWRNGNFFGDARKLRLTALYSGILSKLQAEFTQPYFVDRNLSLVLRSSLRHETEPVFTADRVLASVGLSRPVATNWRGRINYEFSWQDVVKTTLDASVVLRDPIGISRTATIELGIRRQTLDDLLDPRKGTWFDLLVAPSFQEIGSDFDFVTFLAEGRAYVPFIGDSVLAGRLRIGAEQPFRATTADEIPVTSRFYAGGSSSHRGFQYHQMPPTNTFDVNVGGTSLLEGSVEWRFPIWRKIGGVAFVDSGLLSLRPWEFPLDRLFWAVGPGLRYDTVVGPLRFDYGYLINPPFGVSQHQWFISVGHTF